MTLNVLGPITITFLVLNLMREHNKGVIINVASRWSEDILLLTAPESMPLSATGNI